MPNESTKTKPLSGAQRRKIRVANGLPKYTPKELEYERAYAAKRMPARNKRNWAEFSQKIAAIKLARGCADCGYNTHPAALDFDHLPGTQKSVGVSRLSGFPWEKVEEEIAKCEVVCSNCHRIRTAERRV